jgi:hypothetical protein
VTTGAIDQFGSNSSIDAETRADETFAHQAQRLLARIDPNKRKKGFWQ